MQANISCSANRFVQAVLVCALVGLVFVAAALPSACSAQSSQRGKSKDRSQQIRGKRPSRGQKLVVLSGRIDQSMNPEKFQVDFKTIKTTLNQQVQLARAPFPRDWEKYTADNKVKWIKAFETSPRGKAFLAKNKKLIDDAPAFNLRFNKDGEFIVYDVPPGVYGLQGRVDNDIKGIKHAFEVFAEINVSGQFDEVTLDPIPVVVTPILSSGMQAPKISVSTHNGKSKLSFKNLQVKKGKPDPKYVFLNFWSTKDFVEKGKPDYQQSVQAAIKELNAEGYKVGLLSICLDQNRQAAIRHIMKNQYKKGLHGFTNGWDHETVDRFGVRSTPSGWLLDKENKIIMSQHEFYTLTKFKDSLATVIKDRIDGKDAPTPAAQAKK
jgi:hypothetical protein